MQTAHSPLHGLASDLQHRGTPDVVLTAHAGARAKSSSASPPATVGPACCALAALTAWSGRPGNQRRARQWRKRRSVMRCGPSLSRPPQNLYELLGLSAIEAASASLDLLKQRQRALLRVCHPDVAGDGGSAVTSLLSEAVGPSVKNCNGNASVLLACESATTCNNHLKDQMNHKIGALYQILF